MTVRKKVAPPITPRIVQTHPRQQLFQYGLLLLFFVVTVWGGYEYGRSQAPAGVTAPVTQSDASKQRIAELETERKSLKQQIEELERSVKQVSQALSTERLRKQAPVRAAKPTHKAPAIKPIPLTAESAGFTLGLADIRIEPTESENTYRIAFTVENNAGNDDRITGTIWIAVNGITGKEHQRLSFKTVSPSHRSHVKMGFNQQQEISEEIVLPEGFRPKNIQIEAKPYGEKYAGTSEKINWDTN
ncbi:hypothetical protein MNBD_GAMMA15-2123 [hydrothermal vent metagenome]|uniref:Uncharacterized protein n=1 Tax=hydrothermal vent metagenome TaxID=652676 RepID=A0A3B0YRS6_9ZZZZ